MQVGQWNFQLKGRTNNCKTTILVLTKLNQNVLRGPVRLRAWTRLDREVHPPRLTIFADVMQNQHPVVNMNVTAFVYQISPRHGKAVSLELLDNGAGKSSCSILKTKISKLLSKSIDKCSML